MHIPLELQILICQNMTKAELKCARLVCKSLDRAAVPFLFDEVYVAASYSALEIADLITSRFGLYIKTITLSIVDYTLMSKEHFLKYAERRTNMIFLKFGAHVKHAFDLYDKARTEDIEIKNSGELLARLCLTLSKSPNIRRFLLTDYDNDLLGGRGDPLHRHNPWKKDVLCPFKDCELSVSDHIGFLHYPGPPMWTEPDSLHLAMLAISVAKSTITELALTNHRERAFRYEDSLVMTARQFSSLKSQFQSLTKLRLGFGLCPDKNHYDGSTVAKALSVAVNLESLSIEADSPFPCTTQRLPAPTMMSSLLGGCKFPKLKSLLLRFVDSRDDEFLGFLKNSPRLMHLTLDNFHLDSGAWERLFEEICSIFQLKSVRLHKLHTWVADRDEYKLYHRNHDYSIILPHRTVTMQPRTRR